jgi:hypothetical protein
VSIRRLRVRRVGRSKPRQEGTTMRVMVLVKATERSEAGTTANEEQLAEMMKYNEELAKAGVMLGGDGLRPSSHAARVEFTGDKRKVVDGPFSETKELVAGYWLWQVKTMDEAIEWAKRCPNPTGDQGTLELRQVHEPEDFGDAYTPEIQRQEARIRASMSDRS